MFNVQHPLLPSERDRAKKRERDRERSHLILTQPNEIISHFLGRETRHREIDNSPMVAQLIIHHHLGGKGDGQLMANRIVVSFSELGNRNESYYENE